MSFFYPGGKIVTTMISRYIGPSPSELGSVPDVDELGMIAAEPVVVLARKLEKKVIGLWLCASPVVT